MGTVGGRDLRGSSVTVADLNEDLFQHVDSVLRDETGRAWVDDSERQEARDRWLGKRISHQIHEARRQALQEDAEQELRTQRMIDAPVQAQSMLGSDVAVFGNDESTGSAGVSEEAISEVLAIAQRVAYTRRAPRGWQPPAPSIPYLPPGPQVDNMRDSLLQQLQRGIGPSSAISLAPWDYSASRWFGLEGSRTDAELEGRTTASGSSSAVVGRASDADARKDEKANRAGAAAATATAAAGQEEPEERLPAEEAASTQPSTSTQPSSSTKPSAATQPSISGQRDGGDAVGSRKRDRAESEGAKDGGPPRKRPHTAGKVSFMADFEHSESSSSEEEDDEDQSDARG